MLNNPTIDIESLRSEVYKVHNKRLDANDPVFMMVTMNEILIANYLEQFKAMLEVQNKQQDIQATEAIQKHLKGSTDLSNRLFQAMHEDFEKTRNELQHLFQGQLKEIKQAKENAFLQFNAAAKALQNMGYVIALLFGGMLGFIFRGFLPH